jgi:putative endonuclease
MDKRWYIYILANNKNWVLYIWVTSDLYKRIHEHKNKTYPWFSSKYNCNILVYYEECTSITDAITREKQLKWWSRKKKIELIKQSNPERIDLAKDRY